MSIEWERIEGGEDIYDTHIYRAPIRNGWLVKASRAGSQLSGSQLSLTFVPDKEHIWVM